MRPRPQDRALGSCQARVQRSMAAVSSHLLLVPSSWRKPGPSGSSEAGAAEGVRGSSGPLWPRVPGAWDSLALLGTHSTVPSSGMCPVCPL